MIAVLGYEPLGESRTRVTISSTGWGRDPRLRRPCQFFRAGDAKPPERIGSVYGQRADN